MATDSDRYDISDALEWWSDQDLIKYANDTEFLMSLEKHQVVKIAQELSFRYEDVADKGFVHEYND